MHQRRGFTLIELLVSISIITILGLMAVPGTARAIARGAANKAADDMLRVAHQAQQFAKRGIATGPTALAPHWGVKLRATAGAQGYATVLFGTTNADEWMVDGNPGFRLDLPSNLKLEVDQGAGIAPLNGEIAWFYQYGTGWPIKAVDDQAPINIGTKAQLEVNEEYDGPVGDPATMWRAFVQYVPPVPASPVSQVIRLTSLNGGYSVAIAIYDFGMSTTLGYGN